MTILSILNEIAATSSRKDKEAILKREKNNELLKQVIVCTYHPYVKYGIKQIPSYFTREHNRLDLGDCLNLLSQLATRRWTGNAAIDFLDDLLSGLSADDAVVLSRVIDRDLRAGFSDSTANKVWHGLIPTFDVLLCHKNTSGIVYPAFAQLKGDGMRCHIYFDGVSASCFARSGKQIFLKNRFDATAKLMMKAGETWDGELVCVQAGKILPRKTGNGILNKAIKETISDAEIDMVQMIAWDIVDFGSTIRYDVRLADMTSRFDGKDTRGNFIACYTEIVKNYAEAYAFYLRMRADNQEGAVIKNFDLLWEGKRVSGAGKMKAEEEADLVIREIIEGDGKYVGMMGAARCETSEGMLTVNVGIGWSDAERLEHFIKKPVGMILTVRYNEKIQDKRSKKWSLFLPRAVELRFDKEFANTFDELA